MPTASYSSTIPTTPATTQSTIQNTLLPSPLTIPSPTPDQAYAAFIRQGLSQGFRIGCSTATTHLISRCKNHPSAHDRTTAVDERILSELSAGRLHGPIPPPQKALVHISSIGVVLKPHQPDKWRMITDLLYPRSASVNDGISPNLCSLHYSSVDDAVALIRQLGRNTLLIKLDIKDAYRIVPVHPADYPLLGISWRDQVYIDRALPLASDQHPSYSTLLLISSHGYW